MINDFLYSLSHESAETLYTVFGGLQWPVYIGILLLYSVRYSLPQKQKMLLWLVFAIALVWGNALCSTLSGITKGIVPGINMGVSFLFFLLVVAVCAYMLRIPVLLSLDTLVPVFLLGRGVAILGCVFTGCCHGFPSSWGLYSRVAGNIAFPTVIFDSAASSMIVAYLLFLAQKTRYSGNGRVSAMGVILFGLLRIAIDMLRDNHKLLFLYTVEGFCGLIYVFVGALILLRLNAKESMN